MSIEENEFYKHRMMGPANWMSFKGDSVQPARVKADVDLTNDVAVEKSVKKPWKYCSVPGCTRYRVVDGKCTLHAREAMEAERAAVHVPVIIADTAVDDVDISPLPPRFTVISDDCLRLSVVVKNDIGFFLDFSSHVDLWDLLKHRQADLHAEILNILSLVMSGKSVEVARVDYHGVEGV